MMRRTIFGRKYVPFRLSSFGSVTGGTGTRWIEGALAPNGKIYSFPYNALDILSIDPIAKSVTQITGPVSWSSKYSGTILAPNGLLYPVPASCPLIYTMNPIGNVFALAINLGTISTNSWYGGQLASNGKIYCIPRADNRVLIMDTNTNTASYISGVSSTGGTLKYLGAVMGANGKIYGAPYSATQFLEIDPATDTLVQFGSLSASTQKWFGGVSAPNGKIYFMPYNATQVLELDPVTHVSTLFGSVPTLSNYSYGFLGPDGKIYCMAEGSGNMLVIDPNTLTVSTHSTPNTNSWRGFVKAFDNHFYGMPYTNTSILEITF